MWVYPNVIQPLFNEFKQLQDLVERPIHVKTCEGRHSEGEDRSVSRRGWGF